MSSEPTLAKTIYHKGRKYRSGMTADEIGPVAIEFGTHVWVDGKAPAKESVAVNNPDGGSLVGTPPVPTPSALPGPATSEPAPVATLAENGGSSDDDGSTPKNTTTRRRGGSGS